MNLTRTKRTDLPVVENTWTRAAPRYLLSSRAAGLTFPPPSRRRTDLDCRLVRDLGRFEWPDPKITAEDPASNDQESCSDDKQQGSP
jgi:hypothetical protein